MTTDGVTFVNDTCTRRVYAYVKVPREEQPVFFGSFSTDGFISIESKFAADYYCGVEQLAHIVLKALEISKRHT